MTASRGIGRGGLAGEDHPRALLTVEVVQALRRRAADGESYDRLAVWAGVSRGAVRDAVTGVTWPSVDNPPPLLRRRRWTRDELAALTERSEDTAPAVATDLGRTPHAVRQQRYKRGL